MNTAILYTIVAWLFVVGIYHSNKPLPHGIDFESDLIKVHDRDAELLMDLTSADSSGETVYEQEIFDSVFTYIKNAEEYILIDMFLFNSYVGPSDYVMRDLTGELKQLLIAQKQKHPDIKIDFITDPVNVFYGGAVSPEFTEMRAQDINVIITDLHKLRDSAPLFSSIWRTFFQWFGNTTRFGILPNPFDMKGEFVTLRSYLNFLNLKANHRKICIIDTPEGPISFILSANAHSASSDFSNIGVMVRGEIALPLYETEKAVAELSGGSLQGESYLESTIQQRGGGDYQLQILTEEKINDKLMSNIDGLMESDTMYIGMFYFSSRDIIKGLLRAADRGAVIKIVLDPNKDGFGLYRSGLPTQVIAGELTKKSAENISIRWYWTRGEQFHSKLMLVLPQDGPASLVLGSSNYTRRNLENYNLELDVGIIAERDTPMIRESRAYFEKIWQNSDKIYTTEYKRFENTGPLRTLQYYIQESFGLGVY